MFVEVDAGPDRLIEAIDAEHASIGRAQRRFLSLVREVDHSVAWEDSGARDTAHWLGMRYGISSWKAHRWVRAAHALESLPRIGDALARGDLGVDKVVELARFAQPSTEARLVRWAQEVSCGAIRRRAELAEKLDVEDDVAADGSRFLEWWYVDEERRFCLRGELPAADGAIVARALERAAERIPGESGAGEPIGAEARLADALVGLCSARLAADPDPARATVVIHAQLAGLNTGAGGCELAGGPVIHPETVRRLLCTSRVQAVAEEDSGEAVGLGRTTRVPSASMVRQVRHRDRGCRFPGCGTRAFTEAHHIVWWRHGGRTDLDNLLLICSFHHRLVHEHGWLLKRDAEGVVRWFLPDGRRYRAGPSPPASVELAG